MTVDESSVRRAANARSEATGHVKRLVIVLVLMLSSTLGIAVTTIAQADRAHAVQFTTYPVGEHQNRWFQIDVAAGETVTLTAGVINKGSASVSLRAFVANAGNAPNGGFSAGTELDTLTGPSLWVDFAAESFSIVPGETREWEFTVTVPEGTPAGQYVAALVVRTEDDLHVAGSDVFGQVLRSTLAIEITVPGEMSPGFELGEPVAVTDATGRWLQVPVTNTGNLLVLPEGELRLTRPDGVLVSRSVVAMGSIYPGATVVLSVPLGETIADGNYAITAALSDESTSASAELTASPIRIVTDRDW